MGIYDIMDEIAAKQVMKSDTGDNRILGVVAGVVVDNYNQQLPGRVCVQIPVRDKTSDDAQDRIGKVWARVAMPFGGASWGQYFFPEKGDQVLLAFEHGNIEKAFIVGSIYKDNASMLKSSIHMKNQNKKIVTKNGNTIAFEDVDGADGQKDKISIYTANKSHTVSLDNEKNQILISDKEGKNKIQMDTEKGNISVKAENKLTISVGDNIELTMNGNSGTVTLKCGKLNVETDEGCNLKSSGKFGISGGNVSIEASSVLKAESSGMTNIGGSPIKIG